MTKSELIERLSNNRPDLPFKVVEEAVNEIIDLMTTTLAEGRRIEIRGFGSFCVRVRPAREGRNPKTGKPVRVPEKRVPHFKAGKELRERVNEAGA